jgi:SAM-dependent methyltransferase
MDRSPKDTLAQSWIANASAWTRAVREGWIPSRAQATDAALLDRLATLAPKTLLDLGCGEGWLRRALADRPGLVRPGAYLGVDAAPALVDTARAADPDGAYETVTQEAIAAGAWRGPHAFDAIVCNYALFAEDLTPLFTALSRLLGEGGHLVIQTLHPWTALSDGPYADGWRTEDFSTFTQGDWTPMPWYARTLESWLDSLRRGGLRLVDLREPAGGDPRRPLSLLLTCARG